MTDSVKKAYVSVEQWKGEAAIHFGASGYEAVILPDFGGMLVSLENEDKDLDLLRSPGDMEAFRVRPQVYGIPVLFPPNRIEKGIIKTKARTYSFPINEPNGGKNHIHGLLRFQHYELTGQEAADNHASVEICFTAHPGVDFFSWFPHEFTFKILYTLSEAGLQQKITITNMSSEPMPMGLGFHTAFNTPFHRNGNADTCLLKVTAGQKWVLTESLMPTGELVPSNNGIGNKGIKPQGDPIMEHYTAEPQSIGGRVFNGARLEDASVGLCLVYEVGSSFGHWVVWNEDGKGGFICPEPQTWAINAPNLDLPGELTGYRLLMPGETWEEFCSIRVESLK